MNKKIRLQKIDYEITGSKNLIFFNFEFIQNEKKIQIQKNLKEIQILRQFLRKENFLHFIYPLPELKKVQKQQEDYYLMKEVQKFFLFITEHIELQNDSYFFKFLKEDFNEKQILNELKNFQIDPKIPHKYQKIQPKIDENYFKDKSSLIDHYHKKSQEQKSQIDNFCKEIVKTQKQYIESQNEEKIENIFKFIKSKYPKENKQKWQEIFFNAQIIGQLINCQIEICQDFQYIQEFLKNQQIFQKKLLDEIYELGKLMSKNQDIRKDLDLQNQQDFKRRKLDEVQDQIKKLEKLLYISENFILDDQSEIISEYKDTQKAIMIESFREQRMKELEMNDIYWQNLQKKISTSKIDYFFNQLFLMSLFN